MYEPVMNTQLERDGKKIYTRNNNLCFFLKLESQKDEHVIQHIMAHFHKDTDPWLLCHFLYAHPYFLHLSVSLGGRE